MTDLEQMRRLLEDLSAICAADGFTVEAAAPDAIDGVSPRLLAATRASSPAGEPILLRGRDGREAIAVVDGRGHPGDIWEAIRVRTARVVIRRRVETDKLTLGLSAVALRSDDRITVIVSEAIPGRLQRAGVRSALRAASGAGWTRSPGPAALPIFTGVPLWRATLASRALRFAVAGFAALILAVAIGAALAGPAHSPPVRAVVTQVTPSGTPHVRGATKRAAHSPGHAPAPRPGRPRVVARRQPARTAGSTPTEATPAGPAASPHPSSSPYPSPSPSPSKTRHCIIPLIC